MTFVGLLCLSPGAHFSRLTAFEPWADAFIGRSWLALAAAQRTYPSVARFADQEAGEGIVIAHCLRWLTPYELT